MRSRVGLFSAFVAVVAAALLVLPIACSGGPRNEEVGKLNQRCFPGDPAFCDPGLTCVATAVPSDAQSMGTDGGYCFDLSGGGD